MFDVNKIARPCILVRKEYVPGKPVEEVTREYGITDIIKLASNENPLGASPLAVEAMIKEIRANANYYPESLCPKVAEKLAEKFNLSPNNFYIDNGEDGVITMLGLTFINPGDECIMAELTFPAYENIVGKMDGKSIVIPMTKDYRFDVDGMIRAITPKTKIVFLCNPNNPTGTIIYKDEFERLLAAVPENTLFVCDEAYYEFVDDPNYPQSLDYFNDHPNLIVMRTFSKIMGLASVRIGYAIAHKEIVQVMLKTREPFPVNRVAQAGALAAMDDKEFCDKTFTVNAAGRKQLFEGLKQMGFEVYAGQANFIFANLGKPSMPVFEGLLKEGVIIRPLAPQGAPNCIRVTIGTPEQNERFLNSFRKVFSEVYP
ncbi:MAG TPA: histidinol-phosphate transaminase [Flexilinea sp.]|nr:histidinol-phosphate transaminase [Flexilinea sp.]